MGNGYRSGDVLNFQITANYDLTAADLGLWQRAFSKASELLWNATEGQLRFGTILVTDALLGVNNAEYVLSPLVTGRALATWGKFGQAGQAVQLPAYAQSQVLSIVHELGHHLWTLDEEYARAEGATIDTGATLPAGHGNRVIPLTTTALAEPDANYAGADALLVFAGTGVETREIVSKVGNRITVDAAFSQNPQTDTDGRLTIQWTTGVECTGDRTTGACVMEFSRDSAGTLAADGTWTAAVNPVTEFCTQANHDADTDTGQHKRHAEACWKTITEATGYGDLAAGAPATSGPASTAAPAGWVAPTWTVLSPTTRLALVLDRSGSMNRNGGARLTGLKNGAQFWIENAAVEDDELTIVWYNTGTDLQLALTEFGALSQPQVDAQLAAIAGRGANGGTNIVGGLREALTELTGPATPASLQTAVLITDGAHNTPVGTAMRDVVPDFRAANTNIFTLGIGTGDEMDLPGLAALATATGGMAETAGDGSDANAIQDALIEINAVVRGGMISTTGSGGGDTKKVKDRLRVEDVPPEKRPTLRELVDRYDLLPWEKALGGEWRGRHRYIWFGIEVEQDVRATTFTLSHDPGGRFWMYLLDPDGREIHPSDGDVLAWRTSGRPYEFAKLQTPKPGLWTVLALRLDHGPAVPARAIAAIDHPEVTAQARADRVEVPGPVRITASARYVEPLTGLSVVAQLASPSGMTAAVTLHDDEEEGVYIGWAHLPDGLYRGHVELRSTASTRVAGLDHAMLHAEDPREVWEDLPRIEPFVRHLPLTFAAGPVKVPDGFPDDERRGEQDHDKDKRPA